MIRAELELPGSVENPTMRRLSIAFVCLLVVGAIPAGAQTPATRAEALQQARQEKQKTLTPNRSDGLQKTLNQIENPPGFLNNRDGFYPRIGSLTTGSGFALGVGYRNRQIFRRRGALDVFGAGSFSSYWAIEARTTFPDLAQRRLLLEAVGGIREYPGESFFGLGPDSNREDRTSFLLRTERVGGRAGVRIWPNVLVGAEADYMTPRTGSGNKSNVPDINAIFTPAEVPGLNLETDYQTTSAFVEVDYREPLNARKGGWYRVNVSRYKDRGDQYSFRRTDVDLRQFIGFFSERRVIALRGAFSTSDPIGGTLGQPFFLMPTLGGNDTLRGFRNYRFRGPHALLLQAEYRYEIWSGLDGAIFYDTGQVALDRSDFRMGNFEKDYGIGFRFNTDNGIILRVDAAFGSTDGKHLHIIFGGVF
jgi:hypothetical protein